MSERDIFTAAREMTDPVARSAYLDGACGGDAGLRSRVEALLRAHDRPDSLLDHPAIAPHEADSGTTRSIGHESDDEVPLGFLAPPTRPDSLGRIGHYELLQVLGHGGFGIVFRAFDEVLQRVVAVKVLSPQLAATSPARKRFLREARSSAQVRHENVVQVYEVGEQPLPYIAMEFIPGETLQQRLDRTGPIDVAEVVRIGRQVAEGLAAAHAQDLIHRDIKPGNILLEGGAGRVKITDFGLARTADDASISQSGIIAGTPMYMAPEQAKGDKLDQRADLFSLGSVLYQMASGRPPFRANGTVAVLKRVAEDTPRDIREIVPEVPQWLCDIIAKLHAKDPADRFQSAREVADVLADCEEQLKANSKLKDFSRIPRSKQPAVGKSGRWKWAAAVLLLPVFALAATEFAGVTHLLWEPPASSNSVKPGGDQTPIRVAKGEPPPLAIAPFDAAQAKAHQEAWAKHLGVPVEYTNGIGMTFCLIPPGKFTMGSSREEIDRSLKRNDEVTPKAADRSWRKDLILSEGPGHAVQITRPFYLAATHVTVGQYRQFAASPTKRNGGDRWQNPGWDQGDNHPALCVTWDDAMAFCDWLSETEGGDYRLPTEAEWEYACRAGTTTRYWFGDNEDDVPRHAWVESNSQGGSHPVRQFAPNPFGLYDMCGNGRQWCRDLHASDFYMTSPVQDPFCGAGSGRLARGGAWLSPASFARSACRECTSKDPGTQWGPDFGMRAALSVDSVKAAIARRADYAAWAKARGKVEATPHKAAAAGSDPNPGKAFEDVPNLPALLVGFTVTHRWYTKSKGITILESVQPIYLTAEGVTKGKRFSSVSNETIGTKTVLAKPGYAVGGIVARTGGNVDRFRVVFMRIDGAALNPSDSYKSEWLGGTGGETETNVAGDGRPVVGIYGTEHHSALTSLGLVRLAVAPFTDADVKRIAALPATEQVEEVRKELVRRNPGFDGKMETKIEGGAVTEFRVNADRVTDISPIRVWGALRVLACGGTWTDKPNGLLADLTPLEGMNLAALTHLGLARTKVSDAEMAYFKDCKGLKSLRLDGTTVTDTGLAHFKDCKDLTYLNLSWTKVSDVGLAHFKDCKDLTSLLLSATKVDDAGLAHFKGMPLRLLWIDNTGITDLNGLQGMPLEDVRLTPKNITNDLKLLRDMKSLKTIGISELKAWPATEFWERYDKGEFKE